MSARLNRRGAILPLTILMLAIMGVAVAITYTRLASERRTTADAQAQVQAFAVAQSGVSRFLSTLNAGGVKPAWPLPLGAPTVTTVTYNDLPGGTATVSLTMLRESTITLLPAVYAITSRGVNTTAKRYGASAPAAERSVVTFALWTPAPFEMFGAVTSLGGLSKNGTSGTFSGHDRCAAAPPINGVAVPTGGYTGPVSPIDGVPDNSPYELGTGGVGGNAKDSIDIDWAGIVAWPNTSMWPDHRFPTAPFPTNFADWPVVRVDNTAGPAFDLPNDGKGILIVTGDLTISGSRSWEGLILVGGALRSNGNNQVYGAVVSGLNIKLGIDPGVSDLANGNKTYQYDSCSLKRALGNVGSIQRVRNGWIDTWPSY